MKYYGRAHEALQGLLLAFDGGHLPQALAQVFLHCKDDVPCRQWSWNNQILLALAGYTDARGFQQWQEVGRRVKAGEKAFAILAPLSKVQKGEGKEEGDAGERTESASPAGQAGEEGSEGAESARENGTRRVVYGFKGIAVFGLEQTEGDPLPPADPALAHWIQTLPLLDVAQAWNLPVTLYTGQEKTPRGHYVRGKRIGLGVKNLATWAHELLHAADDRNGTLIEKAQHWRAEAVAELGGAVLLECLGYPHDSDRGGCWEYVRGYAEREGLEPLWVCTHITDRVCRAVARLLQEAENLRAGENGTEDGANAPSATAATGGAKPRNAHTAYNRSERAGKEARP